MARHRTPRLIVFDLDGTLVNSLRDIAEALNECLELLGLPPRPVEDYRYMVGEGVPKLCQRAIGESHPHLVDRLIELARPRYRVRPIVHTQPYPGVAEAVAKLARRRERLAVLSNKPHDLTRRIVRHFWPDAFGAIQGYVEEDRRKPDPRSFLKLCRWADVDARDAWMIGDTPTDVATARNAGARCAAVTWGFRARADLRNAGAEHIVDTPRHLLELLRAE